MNPGPWVVYRQVPKQAAFNSTLQGKASLPKEGATKVQKVLEVIWWLSQLWS